MMGKDIDGIIEIPFKLVMTMILLIIITTVTVAGLDRFSENAMEEKAQVAVTDVIAAAGDVNTMGVNSSVKVRLDLTGSAFHSIDKFSIGCAALVDDYKCKGVEYNLRGFDPQWKVVKDHAGHDVILLCNDGQLVLGEGVHELMFIKKVNYIEVQKV